MCRSRKIVVWKQSVLLLCQRHRSRSGHLRLLALGALILLASLLSPRTAHAQKTLKLNFSSTDKFTESDDVEGTATASGLTAAQKAAVIMKVQKKYDDALGANMVTVSEGSGGDTDMIIQGGKAPGTNAGKEAGDAGKPGKPGVVHVQEIKDYLNMPGMPATDDEIVCTIAETAAHEAGHKYGLSHNWESPPTLMTTGSKVTKAQRKADNRSFTADDTKKLQKSIGGGKKEHKDGLGATDLGIFNGDYLAAPVNLPDGRYLDVKATLLNGPAGVEFGYISHTGEFVFNGDQTNGMTNPAFISFVYGSEILTGPGAAGADMAVAFGSSVFSLSTLDGSYALSAPNPNNPAVFGQALLFFNTPFGSVNYQLDVIYEAETGGTTGGFYRVPEPMSLGLAAISLGALPFMRKRRRR